MAADVPDNFEARLLQRENVSKQPPRMILNRPGGNIPNTVFAVSGIAFLLGAIFSLGLLTFIVGGFDAYWWSTHQLGFFVTAWATFHWAEFAITAGWNFEKCSVDCRLPHQSLRSYY